MDMSNLYDCRTCGAVVKSRARHREWHETVEQIARTAGDAQQAADEAQETAEHAANVLYQNNIQI